MATKLKIEKRGDEIKKKSSPLKLLSQSQPNFAEMILGWSPFKIVSVSVVLYPRWPPLLKIEISSPYVLFLVTAAMLVGARHHRTQL
jgi:predicted Rossmann fold nucleotide-binding protein DprA/Smf involved in DNA uptake